MNIKCRIYLGGAKENMKNFNRNLKAISPIFATLILIAIAVIAGVVVYMFTSGTLATMTGGGTAGTEKVSVQAVQATGSGTGGVFTKGTDSIKVYATTATGPVTISSAIFKDSSGNVVGTSAAAVIAGNPITSSLTTITITPTAASLTLATGTNHYTVTLVSANGGNFVSPSFTILGA
jgi:flagellin-like protein